MDAQSLKAKFAAGAVVATVILGSTGIAFAQPANSIQAAKKAKDQIEAGTAARTGASTTAQIRQQNTASTSAVKKQITKRVELKEKLTVKLEEKARVQVGKTISNRIQKQEKAIEVVTNFVNKVEARIASFKARGVNTAQPERFITSAKIGLESAKTQLETVRAVASTTVSSNTPKVSLENMRITLESITLDTKAAHISAVNAIMFLKDMSMVSKNSPQAASGTQATSTNQ